MAINYQAKIDLIVGGLKDIEAAEKRIKSLLRESKKLTRGGLAQRGTVALAATTREGRQQSRREIRTAERRIELQSKLNSATDLYNRKLQQFQRVGAQGNKQLQGRVDQITQAFAVGTKEGTKNLRLTRALATELGRVVEKQRELNRARTQRTKGFEAKRRGLERVEVLRSSGLVDRTQINRAAGLVRGISPAAASGDQAKYNEAVRKADVALRRLERELKDAERAQRASTKAKRDVERAEKKLATETKRAADAQKKRRSRRIQDIATGAGFPLLFGGGPIQALAGGLGGAFGGMGGSIAATAAVSQVQAFATQAAELGQALNSTGEALDLAREKSLFSSDEAKERARKLEKLGDVEGLAALLTQELTDKIGNEGVRSLQELGKTTDETTRLWNELTLQLFTLVSGPLNDFLKLVNNFLKGFAAEAKFGSFRSGLSEKDRARFDQIFLDVRREGAAGKSKRAGIGVGTPEQRQEAIRRAQAEGIGIPQAGLIPITGADRDRFTPPKGKRQKRDRTPGLQAELQLQERLFVLNRGIASAVASKNKNAQAGLQIEIVLERLAAERAKIAASDLDAQDKVLKTRIAEVQADESIAAIVERKNQSEQKRAEAAAKTIERLLNEQSLAQATLDGKLKEEQINQSIARATNDMTEAEKKKVEQVIRGTAALNDQVKALQFQKQVLDGVVNQVGTQLTGLFENLIFQTEDFNKSLNNTLKSLSSLLLKAGLSMLGGSDGAGIFSILSGNFGGKRARGGPVSGGTPYVVGERGPELFVPSRSGTVVPNNALGGNVNVVVNVTEGQTDTRGGNGQANQLGNAIAAAVQSELIKQKRPGGLLAS